MAGTQRMSDAQRRRAASERAAELRGRIAGYLAARDAIPTGMRLRERTARQRGRILEVLCGTEADWRSWSWQLRNRIGEVEVLARMIELPAAQRAEVAEAGSRYRWAVSPYTVSLMDPQDPTCPIRRQALPSRAELAREGTADPMAEELTSPVEAVTRRYPDRVIINVTNRCAMFCRHCQRRRNIGEQDRTTPREVLEGALGYVRSRREIRDVLLTGGDAFLLNNATLDWLLGELDAIPHVEIKRLGTRTPVTLPQRVTDRLCAMLSRHHPVYVNTQFNHPAEVTDEAAAACGRLADAGVPLGNQAVLLAGVNDDAHVMKRLNQELLRIRVRPYYLFHAKAVTGTTHFVTRVEVGLEIMEQLRGQTSGLAIPTYIINSPGGYGKVPVLPATLLHRSPDGVVLRTWEGRIVEVPAPGRD